MWLEAIDMCFNELKMIESLDMSTIVCISGCAQQHGSVWWVEGASELLNNMNPEMKLVDNLTDAFSLMDSPTWMDSSTTRECTKIIQHLNMIVKERKLENDYKPCLSTGCHFHERFTGPQIAKVMANRQDVYKITERITLISNFLATILAGSYMPFDVSDAAGTSMLDVVRKSWDLLVLKAIVSISSDHLLHKKDLLRERLGCTFLKDNIVDSGTIIANISPYFRKNYSLPPKCCLTSMMGDTLSSMAGLCVTEDELIISMGTSDTACFWLKENKLFENGHISRCPIDPRGYVGIIGSKNGSKTRERLRDKFCATKSWDEFTNILSKSAPGNSGLIGFYFDLREIYPPCLGDYRFDANDNKILTEFEAKHELRACIEGQFMRLYNNLELNWTQISRIRVTGGASKNRAILQIIADIFNKPVHTFDIPNSACLGAAYMAKFAYDQKFRTNNEMLDDLNPRSFKQMIDSKITKRIDNVSEVINPRMEFIKVYELLIERCKLLEQSLIKSSTS